MTSAFRNYSSKAGDRSDSTAITETLIPCSDIAKLAPHAYYDLYLQKLLILNINQKEFKFLILCTTHIFHTYSHITHLIMYVLYQYFGLHIIPSTVTHPFKKSIRPLPPPKHHQATPLHTPQNHPTILLNTLSSLITAQEYQNHPKYP